MAEFPSWQSDTSQLIEYRYNLRTSWEALCLLRFLSDKPPWTTEHLYRTIAQRAYNVNYQGRWGEVQRLLEAPIHNPQDFDFYFLQTHDPQELYGNLLRDLARIEKLIDQRRTDRPDRRPVRRRIRRRGYQDKGTRRLPHEFHGDPPVGPEREDRRKLISHPLAFKT